MAIKLLIIGFILCSCLTSCGQVSKNNGKTFEEKAQSTPTSKQNATQFYTEGYQAFHNSDFKKAVELYKKAILIDPKYTDAYDNCGLSYRRLGQLDSAEVYYKKSISINPKLMIAHANLAIVYTDKGDLDAALSEFNQIKKYNPHDPEAYYGAADIYLRLQNADKALENALMALKLYNQTNPQYASDAEYYVGLSYYKKNNKEKAKTFMQQAKTHGREIPENYIIEFGL